MSKQIDVFRPLENQLFKYKDHQMDIVNYSPNHILNTPGALQRQKNNRLVCCYAFDHSTGNERIFTGYEDGLICVWDHD